MALALLPATPVPRQSMCRSTCARLLACYVHDNARDMPFEKKKMSPAQTAAVATKSPKGKPPQADPAEPDEDDAPPAKAKPSKMSNLSKALGKAPGYGSPKK